MDEIRVDGLSDLLGRLQYLAAVTDDKTSERAVTNALKKAGRVLQHSAQDKLRAAGHVKSGQLVNNIIVKKTRSRQQGMITVIVSVNAKAKAYKDNKSNRRKQRVGGGYTDYGPLFYARFLEFGTSHQPAYPFLRPAFEEDKSSLPELIRDDLAAGIDKAMKK